MADGTVKRSWGYRVHSIRLGVVHVLCYCDAKGKIDCFSAFSALRSGDEMI